MQQELFQLFDHGKLQPSCHSSNTIQVLAPPDDLSNQIVVHRSSTSGAPCRISMFMQPRLAWLSAVVICLGGCAVTPELADGRRADQLRRRQACPRDRRPRAAGWAPDPRRGDGPGLEVQPRQGSRGHADPARRAAAAGRALFHAARHRRRHRGMPIATTIRVVRACACSGPRQSASNR